MRERLAPFADVVLVALRQLVDKRIGADQLRRPLHILQRLLRIAERDVLLNRSREQENILQDQPDVPPEFLQPEFVDVNTIHQNLPFLHLVEAEEQRDDSRFP